MIRTRARFTGVGNMLQARYHDTPPLTDEKQNTADYENRTWQNKMHISDDGFVQLPPLAPKNCFVTAAQRLGKVPGMGNNTYTKHAKSGIKCIKPTKLNVKTEDVEPYKMFVPNPGGQGRGSRVHKTFPIIPDGWEGECEIYIDDPVISRSIFEQILDIAGKHIGFGAMRIENNGITGGFNAEILEWEEV